MLKAILFDLDDTLIDWGDFHVTGNWSVIEGHHLEKVYAYLETVDKPSVSLDKFKEIYEIHSRAAWQYGSETLNAPHIGYVLYDTAVEAGIQKSKVTIRDCERAYEMSAFKEVGLFPDVIDALNLFRKHGIKMGIVTNAYHTMAMRDIEIAELGILDYFPDCRVSAADAGYLKPHPNIFKQALELLGVTAEETVFIGDNLMADVSGSQSVGMKGVWRDNGNRRPIPSVKPDAIITSLLELPQILNKWYPNWSVK